MAPKQKMGSITHNSAEVSQQSKRGMLTKLRSSLTTGKSSDKSTAGKSHQSTASSRATSGSTRTRAKNGGLSSSLTQGSTQGKMKRRGSTSLTVPEDAVGELRAEMGHGGGGGGVPTSITALVDAASCLTDDMTQNPLLQAHHSRYPEVIEPPLGLESHQRGGRGGTTNAASRALANLHVSGGEGSSGQQSRMLRHSTGSGDYGDYNYGDYGHDDGQGAYYDERGGGVFDDSYMHSAPRAGGHPHRRQSSSSDHDDYMPEGHYRRSAPSRESYRQSHNQDALPGYYRRSSQSSNPSQYGGEHSPNGGYGTPPQGMSKRASIDNSGCAGHDRRSSDPHQKFRERRHNSMEHSSSTQHGAVVPAPINSIVNNTGRDVTGYSSSGSSRTDYRQNHAKNTSIANNPTWFNESGAPSAEPDLRRSAYGGDDDDKTMATMATKGQAFRPSAMNRAKDLSSPTGEVTVVYTDVQGSTSLWESCPSDMKKAQDIHDVIMRQCYANHSGYEITTEGDAFNLAFQHPVDALAFALQAQLKLYKADWPDGILKHPDGKDEPSLKFRGFRVRFGIHHGPTNSQVHEMTGRMTYSGEGVKIAKCVEGMCHGGQILTTMETWKAVSGMAERYLGRPQILDCGEHLLFETKNPHPSGSGHTTTRYTRRIMQLVPSDLAFDFFEARGRRDVPSEDGKMGFEIKDAASVSGRLFPPLTSKRQLTTCFLNAPYANGRVTICFVYTVGLEDNPDTKVHNLGVLAKYLRKQLLLLNPPGYECQEDKGCWMLAFDRMANAVTFGLSLKSTLQRAEDLVGNVDRDNMFKVGILSGPFTSMGPHKTTGMADYFGPIVNRAARVASNCERGQVCVGIPLSNGVTADPPDFGPTINVRLMGIKKLKGITIDVAIFECSKRRIETLY